MLWRMRGTGFPEGEMPKSTPLPQATQTEEQLLSVGQPPEAGESETEKKTVTNRHLSSTTTQPNSSRD